MYPIVSWAGVGLYPKMLSGIESNAWARRCWNVIVRCFMTAVIGFAGGCWALSVMGKATAASTEHENLMRFLEDDCVMGCRRERQRPSGEGRQREVHRQRQAL